MSRLDRFCGVKWWIKSDWIKSNKFFIVALVSYLVISVFLNYIFISKDDETDIKNPAINHTKVFQLSLKFSNFEVAISH